MDQERRNYYRLNESLFMSYVIDGDTALEKTELSEQNENQYAMDVLADFALMTQQIKNALSRVSRSPETSMCIKTLDAKINLLAQITLYQDKGHNLKRHEVNISAGGISFVIFEKLAVDTRLKLKLILPPELNVVSILAKVISCSKIKGQEESYTLSTRFIETNDLKEDMIVRHIMHCQSDQLRSKKGL